MQLNNKGQSLVIFIILIPIFIGMMVMVVDIGNLIYNKQDLDNINKIVLDYGLSNIEDNDVILEMESLALLNNPNINIKIEFVDMEFFIESSYYVKGIFSNIFNTDGYLVVSHYKGYVGVDDKYVVEKIK